MKLNVTQKLMMTLALLMLATSVAWADYTGYSKDYISADGLVFKRQFIDDPTGSTCILIRPSKNNKNVWAKCNDYGQAIGPATVPEGMAAEVHVGPVGDEYTGTSYVIPSEAGGAKVVAIDGLAFNKNTHLTSITFPAANLTLIPGNGFEGCTALKSLNFKGSSIKTIGTAAFAKCTALEKIEDWGNVETIRGSSVGFGYGSFGGCTALTELRIGPSVKYIYGNTFGGCTSLTRLIFEDGDDWLELSPSDGNEGSASLMFYDSPITYVYYGRRLTSNVHDNYILFSNPLCTIEESVRKTIPEMAVEFGTKIDTIRSTMFNGMPVPLVISAPEATYIGTYAFQNANVKSIDVPKIKKIDRHAFDHCLLTTLNFYSVEEIGSQAFQGARLETISLPPSLKYVGVNSFDDEYVDYNDQTFADANGYFPTKSSLKTFRIEDGDDPIELGFNGDEESDQFRYGLSWLKSSTLEELYIGRPVGHEPVLNEYGNTSHFSSALQFRVNDFPKLKKVELTKVKMISSEAFFGDYSEDNPQNCLEEVSLPMVTAIPSRCFKYCTKLKTVNIPKAKTLWDEAFAYTSGDLDISFINTVDSIKAECFAHSGISGELTIPGTLKYLGRAVFYDCENLKKVTFEYGEKPLGMEYFWTANNVSSGVMSIGGYKCGIEEFYFDRSVEPCTYTDYQGYNYTYRFEIAISDGSYGSMGFPNLKNVTIGKKLTSLDGYTFQASGLEFIRCENPTPIALEYTSYEDDDTFNADHSQGPSFSTYVQEKVKLLVPDGSVSKYLAADVWKGFLNLTDDQGDLGTIAITIPAEGITTYSGFHNLDFSAQTDIKPYIVTSYDADNETVQLSEVENVSMLNSINNTGVVIKGKPGTYQIPVVTTKSAYLNMLACDPSTLITLPEEGYTYYNYSSSSTTTYNYYLKNGNFMKSNGSAKVGPNEAYLEIPKTMTNSKTGSNVTLTLGNDAFTPLYPEVSLNFTDVDGLKAYCVTGFTGSGTVTLTRVNKVEAYQIVLLKGTPGATYTIPSEEFKVISMNMLKMNTGESDVTIQNREGSSTIYLYLDGDKFKMAAESGTTIAPGKAYLYTLSSALEENGPEEYAIVCRQTEDISVNGLKGDLNGDGKINVADIVIIVNYLTYGEVPQGFNTNLADIDGDGNVTAADIKAIVNIILRMQ